MATRIAYLAQDKLYLKTGDGTPRLIESPFAQAAVDRTVRDRQRNEWKTQNATGGLGAMMWGAKLADPSARRIAMTGLGAGPTAAEVCYAIAIDNVGGLFVYDTIENQERRVFHRNKFRARDLNRSAASGRLALSMLMEDGSSNLATIDLNGRGIREITEGDSIDQAPAWVPGDDDKLVFQSAGLGRDQLGHLADTSPFAIQQLDLKSGEMTTLLEDPQSDFLLPRPAKDGSLYYIQRPYQSSATRLHPGKMLMDILLFPFRLAMALLGFLNFFSLLFARKPLLTAGGPPTEPIQQRNMMLWGKFIDAEKAMQTAKTGEPAALVPPTWKLMRKAADGKEEAIASSVLSYDVLPDGQVIYTNGSAIYQIRAGQRPDLVCNGKMIVHVLALTDV